MDAVDCCCGSSSNAAAEACGCFPDCLFEACLRCCCMSCGECCCDMLSIFSSGVCTPALMIIDYSCSWTRRSVRYGLVAFGILIACTLLIIGSVQLGRQAGVSGVALLVPGVFAFLLSLFLACGLCYASCAQRLDEGPSPATLARLPAALKPQSLRSASSRRWLESLPAGRVELQEVETRITRQGATTTPCTMFVSPAELSAARPLLPHASSMRLCSLYYCGPLLFCVQERRSGHLLIGAQVQARQRCAWLQTALSLEALRRARLPLHTLLTLPIVT